MKINFAKHFYPAVILLIIFSCTREPEIIPLEGIELTIPSNVIEVGESDTVNLVTSPENASPIEYIWETSDPSIATVSTEGVITGISPGIVTVTAATGDEKWEASCSVNIIRWSYYEMENFSSLRPIAIGFYDKVWCGGKELVSIISTTTNNSKVVHKNITNVIDIIVKDKTKLWIGTIASGIWNYDGKNWTNYSEDNSGLTNHSVIPRSMEVDLEGSLWFGTVKGGMGSGVTMFDGTTWYTFNSDDGLVHNNVMDITVDANNTLWFVTNKGISAYDGVNWVSYTAENTGIDIIPQVFSMAIDHQNNKWFGSYRGVLKFDDNEWTLYNSTNSVLKWSAVNAITVDEEDNKWFACEGCVLKFDGSTWSRFSSYGKVYNVRDIAVDSEGNKWLATTYGVVKLED